MTQTLLILWTVSALFIVFEQRIYRVIIYFGIFSLIGSVVYLFLGSPDVAMAEAAISAFAAIFFIVCIERYYSRGAVVRSEGWAPGQYLRRAAKILPALLFTAALFGLFVYFAPVDTIPTYLKNRYLEMFMTDVGGRNAVTAIYLGYRIYDTLFEALILVIAVVAVAHLSWYREAEVADGSHSKIENSSMAKFTMRIICPIILLFGAYLIVNGHISAGGGFQGGLAVATFFICRYMVYNIYDIPVRKVMRLEELFFINLAIIPIVAIFLGTIYFSWEALPFYREIYLIAMNVLVGIKVACGFFLLFYRYVAIERLPELDNTEDFR